jgi:hypothetical protein
MSELSNEKKRKRPSSGSEARDLIPCARLCPEHFIVEDPDPHFVFWKVRMRHGSCIRVEGDHIHIRKFIERSAYDAQGNLLEEWDWARRF